MMCIPCLPSNHRPGKKQHGHIIARSDNWSGARQSLTCVTSTWSDGTRGPLGLCYPTGAFTQEYVDAFNDKYPGIAYMFPSETRSHFMTGPTFQTLMHGLLTTAFQLKRKELGVSSKAPGLLLADAWSGFHSFRTGLDKSREAWSKQCNVKLPSLQARISFIDLSFYAVAQHGSSFRKIRYNIMTQD